MQKGYNILITATTICASGFLCFGEVYGRFNCKSYSNFNFGKEIRTFYVLALLHFLKSKFGIACDVTCKFKDFQAFSKHAVKLYYNVALSSVIPA